VHIGAVELTDFRNFPDLSFAPAPGLNILYGPNAQGKTNLLEALTVLMVGRSFRGARATELPRWGCPRATVGGVVCRGETSRTISRVVQPREDGVWAIAGEGYPWARVVAFGWQDLALITGGPQARRDFLDGFAAKLYPAHRQAYVRYRRILERRNRLLQGELRGAVKAALDPWNEQLARVGLELLARRRAAQRALQQEVTELYPMFAGGGEVMLAYRSSLGEDPSEEQFRARLEATFNEEQRRGLTLVGPHRDDLVIELDRRELKTFGSRGQQRLVALTLRLAEASPVAEAVGSAPIVLLDDALSELDERAQGRVLDYIGTCGQVYLTSADPGLEDVSEGAWWGVTGGRVERSGLVQVRGLA
jgi:DNA replication and repair protein RecF